MIQKMLATAVVLFALVFGVLPVSADAQTSGCGTDSYGAAITCTGSDLVYPTGGFGGVRATPTPRPAATATPNVPAATTNATGGSRGEATIAFTGSESTVLGYVGAGLIGFGALTVVAARRKSDDAS